MEARAGLISPYVYAGLSKYVDVSKRFTLMQISNEVCSYFKITIHALRGASKDRHFVKPRHIFIGLCNEFATKNANDIAKHIHRTSASVYNGLKSFENDVKANDEYRADYETIKLNLLLSHNN